MINYKTIKLWSFVIVVTCLAQCHNPVIQPKAVVKEVTHQCLDLLCNIQTCGYTIEEGFIPKNSFLSTLLGSYGVAYSTVSSLVEESAKVFDVTKIRYKQPYYILKKKNNVDYFIYKQNRTDFVVFDMSSDSPEVYKFYKPKAYREMATEGKITSSLYLAAENAGLNPSMAVELSEVYAWQIDFTRLQKNDSFKVLYDEVTVDNELIATENIKAAILTHNGREYHAYSFNGEYYDEKGNALRSMFLKSPVQFSRISSKFNKKRRHPIKKRIIPHLGTDYAAPYGTPIIAVADGVVTKASYTKGNGKYVKIRHNGTYETQYLHMSKRGVKVGAQVKQGDVIGYVGSTGLATGPHVCFRFWKNGEQINHLSADLPISEPLSEEMKESFETTRLDLRKRLDKTYVSPEF